MEKKCFKSVDRLDFSRSLGSGLVLSAGSFPEQSLENEPRVLTVIISPSLYAHCDWSMLQAVLYCVLDPLNLNVSVLSYDLLNQLNIFSYFKLFFSVCNLYCTSEIQRRSCKLSLIFPACRQSTPESLLAGYFFPSCFSVRVSFWSIHNLIGNKKTR